MKGIKLDFVGVGVMKGGTTFLSSVLSKHKSISLYQFKEISFFDQNYNKGKTWYEAKLNSLDSTKICGEFSPGYISNRNAVNQLKRYNKDLKVIAVFRNPVDRAYSHYLNYVAKGGIRDSFRDSLNKDEFNIYSFSMYSEDWERWLVNYGEHNCYPIIFENLILNPVEELSKLCGFLGIEKDDEYLKNLIKESEEDKNANEFYNGSVILVYCRFLMKFLVEKIPHLGSSNLKKLGRRYLFSLIKFTGKKSTPKLENDAGKIIYKDYFLEDIRKLSLIDPRIDTKMLDKKYSDYD